MEWQLLAGLQLLIEPYAVTTPLDRLATAWAHVARAGVGRSWSWGSCRAPISRSGRWRSRSGGREAVTTTPEEEREDVWDLGVFGMEDKREMDFTHFTSGGCARRKG